MRLWTWTRFAVLLVALSLAGCEKGGAPSMKGQPIASDPDTDATSTPGGKKKPVAK